MDTKQDGALVEASPEANWVLDQKRRIDEGLRIPARLGKQYDKDVGAGTYMVEYGHGLHDPYGASVVVERWPKGVPHDAEIPDDDELPFPVAPDAFDTSERDWRPVWYPLISDREAELAATRFGSAKRKVARVVLDPPHGVVLTGLTLGEAVARAYALRRNIAPDLTVGAVRTLTNAAQSMGRWGLIDIFLDENSAHRDPENPNPEVAFLIVPRRRLTEAVTALFEKGYAEFEDRVGAPLVPEFDPDDIGSIISLYGKDADDEAEASTLLYADNRQVGAMRATVRPTEKGYPEQPIQVVSRSVFGIKGLDHKVLTFQLVSEIETPCSLAVYRKADPIQVFEALHEMQASKQLTRPEQVRSALALLHEDDQFAVLEYVTGHLDEDAATELREMQFKEGIAGVDYVLAAIGLVKTGRKLRAHVLYQIRLLVGDLIRDLVSLFMKQYRGTYVAPE